MMFSNKDGSIQLFRAQLHAALRQHIRRKIFGGAGAIIISFGAGGIQYSLLLALIMGRGGRTILYHRSHGLPLEQALRIAAVILLVEWLLYPILNRAFLKTQTWEIGDRTSDSANVNAPLSLLKITFFLGPFPFWFGVGNLIQGIRLSCSYPAEFFRIAELFYRVPEELRPDELEKTIGSDPSASLKLLDELGVIIYLPSRRGFKLTDRFRS